MNAAAVLDLSDSPHAAVRPVPSGRVEVADGFWAERMRAIRRRMGWTGSSRSAR